MALPQPVNSSYEDKLAAFDSVPLFMKSLPEDILDDPVVSALQSLVHDGTPDEIAQNFKEQGNDYFKGKRYREALGFYTQGIDANPTDLALHEALLCNRAACNLELKNYGSVLRDCSKALALNARSSKAFYRSGVALLALERFEECIDCCDRCLQFDAQNEGVAVLRQKAAKAMDARDRKIREKQESIQRKQVEKLRLNAEYKPRNLVVMHSADESTEIPYAPHFDLEQPSGSTLIFPVIFLYPQYATSDIIPEFVEDTPFSAHITNMFPPHAAPPSWDKEGEYVDGRLVIYATTHRGRLLKIGKKMTLRDVFSASKAKDGQPPDGLELKNNCIAFAVLPKGLIEQKWIEDFKSTRIPVA